MSVDYFLIDAPHTVPREFAAWEAAKAHHRALFLRCLAAPAGGTEQAELEAEACAAKIAADRLEQIAREAWRIG